MKPTELIEQKRRDPLTKLNKVFDFKQAKGMPYVHADGNTYHFQCRPIDMTNWGNLLTNLNMFQADYIAANQMVDMMTEEDIGIQVDAPTAINIIVQIQSYYNNLYRARWGCKQQIALVTDREQREAIDVLEMFETILNAIMNPTP